MLLRILGMAAALLPLSLLPAVRRDAWAAPGDLDPRFGRLGVASFVVGDDPVRGGEARVVLVQPDGRIVLAGLSSLDDSPLAETQVQVLRLLADGRLDHGFGDQGQATVAIGHFSSATVGMVQPDGKIVLAGYSGGHVTYALRSTNFVLVRFDSAGRLDSTFGGDGSVATVFPGPMIIHDAEVLAITREPQGRLVAVGDPLIPEDENPLVGGRRAFGVARYAADGQADTSFAGEGWATTRLGGWPTTAGALAVVVDGSRTLVGGWTSAQGVAEGDPFPWTDLALARYVEDGSLDPTFGTGGTLVAPFPGSIVAVTLLGDGRTLALGYAPHAASPEAGDWVLARYLEDGSLDPSFGIGGVTTTDPSGAVDRPAALALDGAGRIVACGCAACAEESRKERFAVARYSPEGVLDSSFGTDGIVTTQIGTEARAKACAVQPDGKILLAGTAQVDGQRRMVAARYSGDAAEPDSLVRRFQPVRRAGSLVGSAVPGSR